VGQFRFSFPHAILADIHAQAESLALCCRLWQGRAMGLVRLFLALVVAVDHWRTFYLTPRSIDIDDHFKLGFNAGFAVMFFYVISGFLITYTLTRNYRPDAPGIAAFYSNRFIRIFSLYWPLVILAFLLVPHAWELFATAGIADKFTNVFLLGIDWRIAFVDYPAPHNLAAVNGLGQAWTLGAELLFYLMAPLLMRSWKIGFGLLCLSLIVRMSLVLSGAAELWWYLFFPSTLCFFMFGHLVCLAALKWPVLNKPVLGLSLLAASAWQMTYGGSYAGFDKWRFWSSLLLFVVALPGLFEATKGVRWLNAFGELSYPVYLVHYIVLIVAGAFLADIFLPLGPYTSMVLWAGVATLCALVVHRAVEVPMARVMKAAVRGWTLRSA
jgi:peptidoglycan/LPS O-acetylase OafA/YrhL